MSLMKLLLLYFSVAQSCRISATLKPTYSSSLTSTTTTIAGCKALSPTSVVTSGKKIPIVTPQFPVLNKRGIAYNNPSLAKQLKDHCVSCSWAYNWEANPNGLPTEIEYVPMLHNATDTDILIQNSRGFNYILSYNEPDYEREANLTAEVAADAHTKHLNKYANIALIGSPAITSNQQDPNKGLGWLKKFLGLCVSNKCQIDFCAVHWYGKGSEIDNFKSFVQGAHETCHNKPIWVTEFNATGTTDEIINFMTDALQFLDTTSYVHRYAWHMAAVDWLFNITGLNRFGEQYAYQKVTI